MTDNYYTGSLRLCRQENPHTHTHTHTHAHTHTDMQLLQFV